MTTTNDYYAVKYLNVMVNGHLGVKEILQMPKKNKGIDLPMHEYTADLIEEVKYNLTYVYVQDGSQIGGFLEIILPDLVDMTDLRLVCPYERKDLPQGNEFTEEALRKLCIKNLMKFVWKLK